MRLFVSYCLVPVILIPIAWPVLVVGACALGAAVCAQLVNTGVNLVSWVAEHLRLHRSKLEAAAVWTAVTLGRATARYLDWLRKAHRTTETAILFVAGLIEPATQEIMLRSPAIARVMSPIVWLVGWASQAFDNAFNFVHDEIVPVALDLAERIPLVHQLLLRHAIQHDQ